ncbi:hypothetical protein EV102420_43_00070 [Pseudescherichia vulneris NBRC 102420]|uniref:Uncharacterized protein n=1 Tax=Pseudescherichia vulneris NBRC 102420 TaxID=1115515 RepID=A0A090VZ45_PSEVU|nr:hypothetical protein [Pseudescherichia vulneris]GAL60537.1 hypothetical protein EV102420_43_00070 [Pseudescherichia vulneris NBRC 102420]
MILLFIFNLNAFADSQCGNFKVHWANDGLARINGAKPDTQKITFLKEGGDYNNIKFEWVMTTNQPGVWVGIEFIGLNGKATLNVEWIQVGVSEPRQFATYNCVTVK